MRTFFVMYKNIASTEDWIRVENSATSIKHFYYTLPAICVHFHWIVSADLVVFYICICFVVVVFDLCRLFSIMFVMSVRPSSADVTTNDVYLSTALSRRISSCKGNNMLMPVVMVDDCVRMCVW